LITLCREDFGIKVYGSKPPRPIISFGHLQLEDKILKKVRQKKYENPTPIQSQAITAGLSGRDVIGIAKTGSLFISHSFNYYRLWQNSLLCSSYDYTYS
jgi:superfamily II DNA/RNA helicase